ncbi:hypothetical protein AYO21_08262 [Fonsecaea monophora]|uniref:Uncharacterized protein n=1 Tax=Fonsecaea monophora TaxID=254056 RepID=A0A177F210_9EURO|nr:hypothetical protein AYO21_08262 [Fonsecaea monophora]KAH0848818.1 hypothetical protein FOPE_03023 [Fonsecaea pedrosoi]OAG37530.1 hypothetical protein AYO21_08262 [Fonsecaea monophora]
MSMIFEEYQEKGSVDSFNASLSTVYTRLEQIRRSVGQCPDEILALKNEVTDLKVLLPDIVGRNNDVEHGRCHRPLPAISRILIHLEEILPRVDDAARAYLSAMGTPTTLLGRGTKAHRRQKLRELASLLQQIRPLREQLRKAIASASGLVRVDLALLDVSRAERATTVTRERRQIDTAQGAQRKTREINQPFMLRDNIQHQKTAQDHMSANETFGARATSLVTLPPNMAFQMDTISPWDSSISHIGVTVSRYGPDSCKTWCSCVCHQKCSVNTPKIFQGVFGSLFLGYSGLPLGRQKCSKASCTRNTTFSVKATYHFPSWYFSRAVSLGIVNTLSKVSIHISLRTVVQRSELFIFAAQGNVLAARDILSKKLAHPDEVHTNFGNTALHYAIDFGHPEICELLLHAGADPTIENSMGSSAVDQAWTVILTQPENSPLAENFKRLFGSGDVLDEKGFSVIHKCLLGLLRVKLQKLLESRAADVDAVDTENRTALSWAAQRGDVKSVAQLLRHDADPNICSKFKASPLHYALRSKSPECVRLLVKARASVSSCDWGGWPPVHTAAMNQDDPAYMLALINGGADVNAMVSPPSSASVGGSGSSSRGKTALHRAALNNRSRMVTCLLDHGARINQQSVGGSTPLMEAIDYDSVNVIRVLMRRGADYTIGDDVGQSILHRVASKGSMKALDVLANGGFDLSQLNPEKQDAFGYTARDILHRATSIALSEEFVRAMKDWLAVLMGRRNEQSPRPRPCPGDENETEESSDLDSDDEFFEAQENLAIL